MSLLTEVMPSSGVKACEHAYKVAGEKLVEGGRQLTLVCSKCGSAMESRVMAQSNESKSDQKPLLCEA